jgi:hypothetical protein
MSEALPEPGQSIDLSPGADAALLIASEDWETAWTADGRRHADATPRLVPEEIRQLDVAGEGGATTRR